MADPDDDFPPGALERVRVSYDPIATPPREDLAAIEAAFGHPAPRAFRTFVATLGGGTLIGPGGVLELWWTNTTRSRSRVRTTARSVAPKGPA